MILNSPPNWITSVILQQYSSSLGHIYDCFRIVADGWDKRTSTDIRICAAPPSCQATNPSTPSPSQDSGLYHTAFEERLLARKVRAYTNVAACDRPRTDFAQFSTPSFGIPAKPPAFMLPVAFVVAGNLCCERLIPDSHHGSAEGATTGICIRFCCCCC